MSKLTFEYIDGIIQSYIEKGLIGTVTIKSADYYDYIIKIDDEFCIFFSGSVNIRGLYSPRLSRLNDLNFKNYTSRAIILEKVETPEEVEKFIKNFAQNKAKIKRILEKKYHLCNIIEYTKSVLDMDINLDNDNVRLFK